MRAILLFMAALAATVAAAACLTVLVAPTLVSLGAPPLITGRVLPLGLLVVLVTVPLVLAGEWLWGKKPRRRVPGVLALAPVFARFTSTAGVAVPLRLSPRPADEVAKDAVRLVFAALPQEAPVVVPVLPAPPPLFPPAPAPAPQVVLPQPLPVTPEPTPAVVPGPTAPVVVEGTPTVLQPPPPLQVSSGLFKWVDRAGVTHFATSEHDVPEGVQAVPVSEQALDTLIHANADGSRFELPMVHARDVRSPDDGVSMPSYVEQYWRGEFSRAHQRVDAVKAKIVLKQRELDKLPVHLNREALEQELRDLEQDQKKAEASLQELERQASFKSVPRLWR